LIKDFQIATNVETERKDVLDVSSSSFLLCWCVRRENVGWKKRRCLIDAQIDSCGHETESDRKIVGMKQKTKRRRRR